MPKIIKLKSRQEWISFISCILMIFFSATLYAAIPEPETQISGQVYNLYQNHKVLIPEAEISFTIRKKGSNELLTYNGSVECMKCNAYDSAGVICEECVTYAYHIKIPQITAIEVEENTGQIIPLSKDNQQYDIASVTVNGVDAQMNMKSQLGNIQPDDKQGDFILAGQQRRSHLYEIDLELVLPVTDSDNDQIPDFWEKQYGFDMNDADDATNDSDADGWDNLTEFLNATHPKISNTTPQLLDPHILAFEGASSLLQLNIADSDTTSEDVMIKFINIPGSLQIMFHGANTPFSHGHIFQANEMIPLRYIEEGHVIFTYKGISSNEIERIYIEIIDNEHDPVIATLNINVFKPTTTDATDAVLWFDAFQHSQLSDDEQIRQLQDRSGCDNRGNYYAVSENGELIESEINIADNAASGNPAFNINGFLELPYAKPVFPPGNVTIISVFKVNHTAHKQIIAAGHYIEVAVNGNDDPLHPGELRVADETSTIYSNRKVDNEWVMTSVKRVNG